MYEINYLIAYRDVCD